jgi:hypothetical protein
MWLSLLKEKEGETGTERESNLKEEQQRKIK